MLADSLGHGLQINSSTYLKHEGDHSKLQGMKQAIAEDKARRTEIEILKAKIASLETETEKLRTENIMQKSLLESLQLMILLANILQKYYIKYY
ncbi:MAG: hypothetical protein QNJ65_01020 [Xenococcaceae cyanobacterium MO_234.B1]|nr:hypothetical protein [Xenococcaceae cyanobacterium MO_234.B1]